MGVVRPKKVGNFGFASIFGAGVIISWGFVFVFDFSSMVYIMHVIAFVCVILFDLIIVIEELNVLYRAPLSREAAELKEECAKYKEGTDELLKQTRGFMSANVGTK